MKKSGKTTIEKKCNCCNKLFTPLLAQVKRGRGKYCSVKCRHDSRIGTTLKEETIEKMRESHKGCIPWNTGKHLSEEHRKKISNGGIGKKRSMETRLKMSKIFKGRICSLLTRKKISDSKRGEKSRWWKGGISSINQEIRNSFEYKVWRKSIFIRDDFTCQKCFIKGNKLRGHHIESFHNNPELRTNLENGVTLCKNCHDNFHHIFGKINTRKQFNDFINNY